MKWQFLSSISDLWILSWSLTTCLPDQSCLCPLKPPWSLPRSARHRSAPLDALVHLHFLHSSIDLMRFVVNSFGSTWTGATAWTSRAPCDLNPSVFPKETVQQLPEKKKGSVKQMCNFSMCIVKDFFFVFNLGFRQSIDVGLMLV